MDPGFRRDDDKQENKTMNEQATPQTQEVQAPAAAAVAPTPAVKAILGRKVGMTRILNPKGEFLPVTLVEAGPCPVLQVKTKAHDGYEALQLGFGSAKVKNLSKAFTGHLAKANTASAAWVREVRIAKTDGFLAGQILNVSNFAEGDSVDVSAVNKGKGFAGVVKRHRFSGGPSTHGQSDRQRAPGSSGGQRPQKVFKGVRGPGHMGAEWSTVQRVEVLKVDADKNLLLIHGSVPGPNGGFVMVRATTRPRKYKVAPVAASGAKKSLKPAAKAPPKPAAAAKK
jgi:large subunit ribosomal protein L3